MNEINEQNNAPQQQTPAKEKPGLGKLWADVKKRRRMYYKVLPVAAVLAVVYTLSLPNYYQCTVALAPELSSNRSNSSLSGMASMLGINLNTAQNGVDAIRPDLYPDLMNSVTFRASLFGIKIQPLESDSAITYYDYLLKHQKAPWWSGVTQAVFSIFGSDKEKKAEPKGVNTFKLTKKQTLVEKMISKKVVCDVDKKTFVITIGVTDQDPLVAATVADSVQQRLQQFITDYRTRKARIDKEHYQKLTDQARERYEKALADLATFSDHNQKVFLQSVRSEQARLENELQLELRAYTQMATQLQLSEAKLQEETPAFTTLQPATVPLLKAGPRRARSCIVFLFLAFLGTTVYILHKEGDLMPLIMGGDDEEA